MRRWRLLVPAAAIVHEFGAFANDARAELKRAGANGDLLGVVIGGVIADMRTVVLLKGISGATFAVRMWMVGSSTTSSLVAL